MDINSLQEVIDQQKGLLLIDKPTGITSHGVVNRIRKITGVKKVGHAGTLDPLATGLLIILVGREFTKQQPQFLKQDKRYETTARLGMTTDSYDSDGEITSETEWAKVGKLNSSQLLQALEKLKGEITQTVPAFSAVKVKGQKLYQKARKGEIDLGKLPSRQVNIYQLDLLNFKKDIAAQTVYLTLETKVSSGTYIRSLVHDLGQELGVGATVTALRRTQIGEFSIDQAIKLPNQAK
jgi:tRNA pseudouridine55 synthase